jgi:phosphoglycolate phosphatase
MSVRDAVSSRKNSGSPNPEVFFLPRAVIFDWDNTLVDSWGAISEAINYVRERHGLQTWDRQEILSNCVRSARESFPEWFGDRWQVAWEEYYDYFDKVRKRVGLHPIKGASDLLNWLKDKKIPALVVSNKSGHYLRQEAAQLGWTGLFASIVGAHDAVRDKPAREHADHALSLAGLKGGADILFIGDSEADMACARNAECTPCLIGTKESAQKWEINLFAADCREVLDRLREL